MGRSRLITYTVEVKTDRGMWTPSEWRTRRDGQIPGDGKPTTENLKNWALHYEKSTHSSGCNSHLGVTHILTAQIRDQRTGQIVATYVREPVPMFEVVS